DDGELAEAVATGLRRAQIAVDLAGDGESGLVKALVTSYDVIVLDRDLPGLHGGEGCERLGRGGWRRRGVMLEGAGTIEERGEGMGAGVGGRGLGAEDYLPRPFGSAGLRARGRALFRRAQRAIPPVLAHGDLELDTGKRHARRGGKELALGPKEFGVLELLLA